ncbi:unnamed protein product [Urochloa decumbens]|uniref:Uncharacterized protein n=1 Tax=Urochloa decumbens TaxID=240449 RepID=A0ABC9EA62_9POAL
MVHASRVTASLSCSPLDWRDRWKKERLDYALAYPPTEIHYVRPVARTVTFASNNSVYVIPPSPPPPTQPQQQQEQQKQSPPEPPQQPQTPPQQHEPEQHHDAPQPQPEQPAEAAEPPAQTQDAPPPTEPEPKPKPPKGPKRGKKKNSGRVRFGPEPPPPQQQEEEEEPQQQEEHEHAQGPAGDSGDVHNQQGPHGAAAAPAPPPPRPAQEQGRGYLLRYTPSPLPRWEATPRRHEYFSGEYRSYYPTPVREGIYRIATDANRLTTIFSEENPNACTIV